MNVVITGSTQGIGLGMAREFLRRGHDVMVSSRRPQAVDKVVAELRSEFPDRKVAGRVCNVADYGQVQNLWDRSVELLGPVDIWVNNAGTDSGKDLFYRQKRETIAAIVETNLTGLMYCCQVAINGMYRQGGGRIFNMEGFGSNGMVRPGISVYGTTKCAVRYLTKALVQELKSSPVRMCYLSPGIVITDMLVPPPEKRDARWQRSRKILNVLADTVETVTPWLVEGMLKAERNGDAVRWLTAGKIIRRQLVSVFRKRDVFSPLGL